MVTSWYPRSGHQKVMRHNTAKEKTTLTSAFCRIIVLGNLIFSLPFPLHAASESYRQEIAFERINLFENNVYKLKIFKDEGVQISGDRYNEMVLLSERSLKFMIVYDLILLDLNFEKCAAQTLKLIKGQLFQFIQNVRNCIYGENANIAICEDQSMVSLMKIRDLFESVHRSHATYRFAHRIINSCRIFRKQVGFNPDPISLLIKEAVNPIDVVYNRVRKIHSDGNINKIYFIYIADLCSDIRNFELSLVYRPSEYELCDIYMSSS